MEISCREESWTQPLNHATLPTQKRCREMQETLEAKIAEADRARRLFEIDSEKEHARMVSDQKRRQVRNSATSELGMP